MNIELPCKRGLACFDYNQYEDELLVYIGDDEHPFDWYNVAMKKDKFQESFQDYVEDNGGRETFYDTNDAYGEHTTIEVELPWNEFTETYKARELFEAYCSKILEYHSLLK